MGIASDIFEEIRGRATVNDPAMTTGYKSGNNREEFYQKLREEQERQKEKRRQHIKWAEQAEIFQKSLEEEYVIYEELRFISSKREKLINDVLRSGNLDSEIVGDLFHILQAEYEDQKFVATQHIDKIKNKIVVPQIETFYDIDMEKTKHLELVIKSVLIKLEDDVELSTGDVRDCINDCARLINTWSVSKTYSGMPSKIFFDYAYENFSENDKLVLCPQCDKHTLGIVGYCLNCYRRIK